MRWCFLSMEDCGSEKRDRLCTAKHDPGISGILHMTYDLLECTKYFSQLQETIKVASTCHVI